MFLVIIEIMGVGIVFPMLPELFITKNSVFTIVNGESESAKHIYYGISISLWSLGMFLGTPYLGLLSDKYGRKKVFLVVLLMTSASYAILAIAIYLKSLLLFLVGRTFSGLFAGSYEIAQAAAADLSTPETKARNMGWMILALSMGFILGPLITTLTGGKSSILSLGIAAPFWIASGLALLNAGMILFLFVESYKPKEFKKGFDVKKMFSSFLFVFTDSRLTYLSLIFFCITAAWVMFFTGIPLYLSIVFDLNTKYISLFYCLMGLSNIFTILIIQKFIVQKFPLKSVVIYTSIISAIVLMCLAFKVHLIMVGIIIAIFSIVELLTYSSFLAIYSNAVTSKEQGRAMGGTASLSSLAFIVISFSMAVLTNIANVLPIVISALLFALGGILMVKVKKHTQSV
jgi:MFS family permease